MDAGIEEGLASVAAKIDELEARLKKERAAGDGEAAGTTEYQLNYYKGISASCGEYRIRGTRRSPCGSSCSGRATSASVPCPS